MTNPIIKTVELPCSAAHAFDVFVNRIETWWPLDTHAASATDGKAALGVTIEPEVGGRVFETKHDGSPDHWGDVLEYAPGEKLAITWHPGNNKDNPTRVDVVFVDGGNDICRVTLTHSGWAVWADKADEMRGSYNGGWDLVFGVRFAQACDE